MSLPIPNVLQLTPENRSTNWDLFKQRWNNYEIATGLVNKPEEIKLATLLSTIGEEALIVYNAFNWSQDEEKTVSAVLEKFESYCKPKKNVTYERFLFMSRKQKVGESITDYIVALRNLVKNCDYGPLSDSLVRDAIVLGVRNNKTREALLKENDLSLDTCINIVRANERAHEQFNFMSDKNSEHQPCVEMEVDKVIHTTRQGRCRYCGKVHVMSKHSCPAHGKKCNKCGGLNHFKEVCKTKMKPNSTIHRLQEENESNENDILIE